MGQVICILIGPDSTRCDWKCRTTIDNVDNWTTVEGALAAGAWASGPSSSVCKRSSAKIKSGNMYYLGENGLAREIQWGAYRMAL